MPDHSFGDPQNTGNQPNVPDPSRVDEDFLTANERGVDPLSKRLTTPGDGGSKDKSIHREPDVAHLTSRNLNTLQRKIEGCYQSHDSARC